MVKEVFDFNVHLYKNSGGLMESLIQDEMKLTVPDFIQNMLMVESDLKFLKGANFMIFNQNINPESILEFRSGIKPILNSIRVTQLIDFRRKNYLDYINQLIISGIDCFKFHSYVQEIKTTDFERILEICKYLDTKKIPICFDASFGTNRLYDFDNLKLVAFISRYVKKSPIIILHSGGARAIEAFLIADLVPNIFLETSLSLDFYYGSRVFDDIFFCYKKLGADRLIFASDYPAISGIKESIESQQNWFLQKGFTYKELQKVFSLNAENIFV